MTIGTTIKYTRKDKLGLSLRRFAPLMFRSFQLVGRWEAGLSTPDYTDMFYVYSHADRRELREMAAAVMYELDPDRAERDGIEQPATTVLSL